MSAEAQQLRQMDEIQSLVGKRFKIGEDVLVGRGVTTQSLEQYALQVGNPNPRFYSESYPSATGLTPIPTWYNTVIEPHAPCRITYSARALERMQATFEDEQFNPSTGSEETSGFLGSMRGFLASVGWEYFAEPQLGDEFRITAEVARVDPKYSRTLGPFALVWGEVDYKNQDDRLLARGLGSVIVYDLENAASEGAREEQSKRRPKDDPKAPHITFSEAMTSVERRAAEPLSFDDVVVGQEITPLLKGTLDYAEIAAYHAHVGVNPQADAGLAQAQELLHQGDAISAMALHRQVAGNREFNLGMERHVDESVAQSEGAPGAFDIGVQRAGWVAEAVTNWMGDNAEMKKFAVEMRGFVVVGDTVWCKGLVTDKQIVNDVPLVDIDLWVENQRGERVSKGAAQVALAVAV